jgi:putative ABC transport system permease protein
MLLVLAESLMIAALGGGVGLALAKLFTLRGDPTGGLLPFFYLQQNAILLGVALSLLIGAISALTPAVSAMRLRVVDALRRV